MVTTHTRAMSEGFNVAIDPIKARRQLRISLALVALLTTATGAMFTMSQVSVLELGVHQAQRLVQLPERIDMRQAAKHNLLVGS